MEEIWKDIPGYEGFYQVSNLGRVKSFHNVKGSNERIRKPQNIGQGYLQVKLGIRGRGEKCHYIHALVLLAFVGERPKGLEINHKNGNKHDNRLDNLEYCTRGENNLHSYRVLGRTPVMRSGGLPIASKLSANSVKEIRRLYATKAYTQVELARMFKTSQTNVSSIVTGVIWKDI